jgi:hypothetical protein
MIEYLPNVQEVRFVQSTVPQERKRRKGGREKGRKRERKIKFILPGRFNWEALFKFYLDYDFLNRTTVA